MLLIIADSHINNILSVSTLKKTIYRLLTRNKQLSKVIEYILVKAYKNLALFGIYLKNHQDDRLVLENIIFPYFQNDDEFITIISVGTAWYTKSYNKKFRGKKYWTIDLNSKMKKYGSKKHIVDSLENLHLYFQKNQVDLIVCNGVFGWGLNKPEDIEKSLIVCYDILRSGGVFILGWNDLPEYRPVLLDQIMALKLFKQMSFEPLNAYAYLTKNPNRHTFNFYIKSDSTLTD
jgi:SAM-dependent methyltransferase